MVHARLVLLGPCRAIALHGAMYHIVKFYVATWDAIRMRALKGLVGSHVLCPLASYVIRRSSPPFVSSWNSN